jgi:hypothetical protein
VKQREAERRREKNEAKRSGFCILNGIYMYNKNRARRFVWSTYL